MQQILQFLTQLSQALGLGAAGGMPAGAPPPPGAAPPPPGGAAPPPPGGGAPAGAAPAPMPAQFSLEMQRLRGVIDGQAMRLASHERDKTKSSTIQESLLALDGYEVTDDIRRRCVEAYDIGGKPAIEMYVRGIKEFAIPAPTQEWGNGEQRGAPKAAIIEDPLFEPYANDPRALQYARDASVSFRFLAQSQQHDKPGFIKFFVDRAMRADSIIKE